MIGTCGRELVGHLLGHPDRRGLGLARHPVRLVGRQRLHPERGAPVQVEAGDQPRRPVLRDQPGDHVGEAAHRVHRRAVRRGDRVRHAVEGAEVHARGVQQHQRRGGGHGAELARIPLGAMTPGLPDLHADRIRRAGRGRRRPRRRAAARHPRHRPALPHRCRHGHPRAAHLPRRARGGPPGAARARRAAHGGAGVRAPRPRRPRRRGRHVAGRRGPLPAGQRPRGRPDPDRGGGHDARGARLRAAGARCPTPTASLAGPVLRELRMRKDAAEVRRAARRGRRDRPRARPDGRVPQGGPHRGAGRGGHRRRDRRGGAHGGGVRDRRLGSERREPAPRRVRPGDRGRRRRRDRHRRPAAERLQLRLHPHLRRRPRAVGRDPRGLRRAPARPGAGGGERAARCDGRGGRRRRPAGDHRGRAGGAVHPPHRARHRHRRARGALHRRRQPPAARAGHGVLRGAGRLPRRRVGRAHRGHRRGHRRRASSGSTTARATSWCST